MRPLKDNNPVLIDTNKSIVLIKNTIEFPQFGLIFTNYNENNMFCNRDRDKNCPKFFMVDIINAIKSDHEFNYTTMAKNGAVVECNIVWKCHKPLTSSFNSNHDCSVEYSWRKVEENPLISARIYKVIQESEDLKKRTYLEADTITFVFNIDASLTYFNIWNIILALSSMYVLDKIVMKIYELVIRFIFKRYDLDEVIFVNANINSEAIDNYFNDHDVLIH